MNMLVSIYMQMGILDVVKLQRKGLEKWTDSDQIASEEAVWSGSSLFVILTSML